MTSSGKTSSSCENVSLHNFRMNWSLNSLQILLCSCVLCFKMKNLLYARSVLFFRACHVIDWQFRYHSVGLLFQSSTLMSDWHSSPLTADFLKVSDNSYLLTLWSECKNESWNHKQAHNEKHDRRQYRNLQILQFFSEFDLPTFSIFHVVSFRLFTQTLLLVSLAPTLRYRSACLVSVLTMGGCPACETGIIYFASEVLLSS